MEGQKQEEKKVEEAGKSDIKDILVLTYGDEFMTGVAKTICEALGAVHYNLSDDVYEKIGNYVGRAEYILIGTNKEQSELEFVLRSTLKEKDLKDKKTALFLLDQEETKKELERAFLKWYPEARLLPTFTMQSNESLNKELGRMNGWLTSVLNFEMAGH